MHLTIKKKKPQIIRGFGLSRENLIKSFYVVLSLLTSTTSHLQQEKSIVNEHLWKKFLGDKN